MTNHEDGGRIVVDISLGGRIRTFVWRGNTDWGIILFDLLFSVPRCIFPCARWKAHCNDAVTLILHLRSSPQCCERYGDELRLSIRHEIKQCVFQPWSMLKQATCALSKRSSQAEITRNKQGKCAKLASTVFFFSNAASRTGTFLECVCASYWRRMSVALTALQETTEMGYRDSLWRVEGGVVTQES